MYIPQNTFSGGEVSPDAFGRVDIEKYYTGLETLYNMILHPQGGVSNAPGTYYIDTVKNDYDVTRLVPFVFSADQTYVMVFSPLTIRFIYDGGYVLDGVNIYEVATPYTEDDIWNLRFSQSADVVTITNDDLDIPPKILKRLGNTDWTLTDITFEPELSPPVNLVVTVDSGGTGKDWTYVVTAVTEDGDETRPSAEATVDGPKDSAPDKQLTVTWDAVVNADRYYVYKKTGGSFGYVGQSKTATFSDDYIIPNTGKAPPENRDPFEFKNPDGTTFKKYPKLSYYFQQRLGFANTFNKPQDLWFSKTSNNYNFDVSSPLQDSDALNFTIASNQIDEIVHVISLGDLVVLTAGSEWRLNVEGALSPTSPPNAIPQSYNGSNETIPVVIGNSIIYADRTGRNMKELTYSLESSGYISSILNILAPHLFEDDEIKEMAFAREPYSIIWVVMKSGKLLGFTYLKEQGVLGWHRHDTDGLYESVCSLPKAGDTDIYFVVRRKIGNKFVRYIERVMPRIEKDDIKTAFFVHSGLRYRVFTGDYNGSGIRDNVEYGLEYSVDANNDLTGLLTGTEPPVVGSTPITGSIDTFGNIQFETVSVVTPALGKFFFNGTIDSALKTVGTFGIGTAEAQDESGAWSTDIDDPSTSLVQVVTGLDHLEGKEVAILDRGSVEPLQVVTGGSITLRQPSNFVTVGLPYYSKMTTLNINAETQTVSLQGGTANIPRATIFFKDSVTAFAGSDENQLYEMRFRDATMGEQPVPLFTGKKEIRFGSGFNSNGRVTVEQRSPLPVTILSIVPDVEIGG